MKEKIKIIFLMFFAFMLVGSSAYAKLDDPIIINPPSIDDDIPDPENPAIPFNPIYDCTGFPEVVTNTRTCSRSTQTCNCTITCNQTTGFTPCTCSVPSVVGSYEEDGDYGKCQVRYGCGSKVLTSYDRAGSTTSTAPSEKVKLCPSCKLGSLKYDSTSSECSYKTYKCCTKTYDSQWVEGTSCSAMCARDGTECYKDGVGCEKKADTTNCSNLYAHTAGTATRGAACNTGNGWNYSNWNTLPCNCASGYSPCYNIYNCRKNKTPSWDSSTPNPTNGNLRAYNKYSEGFTSCNVGRCRSIDISKFTSLPFCNSAGWGIYTDQYSTLRQSLSSGNCACDHNTTSSSCVDAYKVDEWGSGICMCWYGTFKCQ